MQVATLRLIRKVHRLMGAVLFIFFFVVAITGVLLGWKKNTSGWLLPATTKGTSTNLAVWKPIAQLHSIADSVLLHRVDKNLALDLDRIDIRKDKGIVKFVYAKHYWEVQLDGATGQALQVNLRKSDFIEDIHDASYLDAYFNTKGEPIKLTYTLIMGVALFLFCATGFWLWYGPKVLRNKKRGL
ncbi:MAG: hypothetical protein RL372_24 [Bacteroidota bacterium]|jgi:uncharacterized iron-regulated membrane protein